MRVRKFRPRRELVMTQATLVQFIGLSWLDRWRWLFFGWRSLTPQRNQTMRQAFRAEKQRTTGEPAA